MRWCHCYDADTFTCSGVKGSSRCMCEGDRLHCTFYPEVREKTLDEVNRANQELMDRGVCCKLFKKAPYLRLDLHVDGVKVKEQVPILYCPICGRRLFEDYEVL